jgi:pristinamycin I synthase-3/4
MTVVTAGFRLSHRQRHLWWLRAQGVPLTTQFAVTVPGHLDEDQARRALRAVVQRHDALRTGFRAVPGVRVPMQVVADDAVVDWRVLGAAEAALDILDRLWGQALARPPAIDDAPPVAAVLGPAGPGDRWLLVSLSALAVDAASIATFAGDLGRAYLGELPAAPEVAQYPQFSSWQHELLAGGGDQQAAAYWRQAVTSIVAPRPLPLQRPGGGPGQSLAWPLGPELRSGLATLAETGGTTLDTVIFAAWSSLVARLTGAERLTIFRSLDGRRHADLQGAVGPFTQPVPVTISARPESRFADVLAQAGHATAQGASWLDFLSADDCADAPGSLGFESVAWPRASEDQATFALERLRPAGSPHDVTLVYHDAAPARLELRYLPEQLSSDDARILADQLMRVLAGVAAGPQVPVRAMPVLTPREIARMDASNGSGPGTDPGELQDLFEDQVNATPGLPAAACGDTVLSYAELDSRANRLAHAVRARGLGPGSVCACWHEPGVEVLVCLLGIIKSGAAYLPIDPRWPPERVAAVIRDAAPSLLLTQERLLAEGNPAPAVAKLCLDRDADVLAGQPGDRVAAGAGPDDLAYIIYTSGSTGVPKGVCVTRRGLANYLSWSRRRYPLAPGRGSLVHSPIGFDLTVTSMFAPLTAGQCVRFAAPAGIEGLTRALAEHDGFSVLKLTPAHVRLLHRMLPVHKAQTLAYAFVIGGEALHEDDLAPWRAAAPGMRIFNEYGPTEAVVGCCVYDASSPAGDGPVPIGHPIANTRLYVLDEGMRRVPLGMAGELYIGGTGVARGYHGMPGLTAERFTPDPFGPEAGARLYRTGDIVRYLPDGTLVFLGRADGQEQVNGVRVEPAEIEAALMLHPQVAAAAVAVRRDTDGSARILAWAVPAAQAPGPERPGTPEPEELKRFLRARLPEYMLPAAISVIGTLPLTANGKVDRSALPDPAPRRAAQPGSGLARTAAEQAVCRVWEELLGIEGIGVDENFLDLGGDSFLLLDVAVQLEQEFGVEVTPLMLLEHPTVATIARLLGGDSQAGGGDQDLPGPEGEASARARHRREAIDLARTRHTERNVP